MDYKKITIVMTYFNRKEQLIQTIKSIGGSSHRNYNIIIVDDCSDTDIDVDELKTYVNNNIIEVIKILPEEKNWNNPVIVYNVGIERALQHNPEIIILQNAEGYHFGDILTYSNNNINDKNYISYGCFSIDKGLYLSSYNNVRETLNDIIEKCNYGASYDCQTAWYNHPVYRPVGYDFCAAITKNNIIKLNGYDERYYNCIGYGDDDLLLRVKRLGLNVEITTTPIVIHQWHEHMSTNNRNDCLERGVKLLNSVRGDISLNYVATHLKTKNFYE
jgi:glycosyltransferase involved in cell wall biosynthesis